LTDGAATEVTVIKVHPGALAVITPFDKSATLESEFVVVTVALAGRTVEENEAVAFLEITKEDGMLILVAAKTAVAKLNETFAIVLEYKSLTEVTVAE